jgi:hypothetical protein
MKFLLLILLSCCYLAADVISYGPNQHIQTYIEALEIAKTGDELVFVETDTLLIEPGLHWVCLPNITYDFTEFTHADDITKSLLGKIFGEMYGMQDGMKEFCTFNDLCGFMPSNLYIFPWSGLKIRLYDERSRRRKSILKIPLNGKMLPQNYQISLTPGKYNWIGYHLPKKQNVKSSFGSLWKKVKMVKAQDWCYFRSDKYFDGSIDPNIYRWEGKTLEFGKMYEIWLDDDVEELVWNQSEEVVLEVAERARPQHSFLEKEHYEPVEIYRIDSEIAIREIGIFSGGKCIGAAVADSLPITIPAYYEQFSLKRTAYEFVLYLSSGDSLTIKNYEVFNPYGNEFVKERVMPGFQQYSIIRFGTDSFAEEQPKIGLMYNQYNGIQSPELKFFVDEPGEIKVEVIDASDEVVATLLEGFTGTGIQTLNWDGKDVNENKLANGIYRFRLQAFGQEVYRKVLLME